MKKTRFTEAQIFNILKEYDAGRNILEVAREHGISKATIYNWKAKYGGIFVSGSVLADSFVLLIRHIAKRQIVGSNGVGSVDGDE